MAKKETSLNNIAVMIIENLDVFFIIIADETEPVIYLVFRDRSGTP